MVYDYVIVGGGIVGLATAHELLRVKPQARLAVLEKETAWAIHQTGHNSGVIHSGLYYKPGSLKASLAIRGNQSLKMFCGQHGIPFETCGKLIVATEPKELPRLKQLYERGQLHGLDLQWLDAGSIRDIEPYAVGLAAIRVVSTGITNFACVAEHLATGIQERGGSLHLQTQLTALRSMDTQTVLETTQGSFETRFLITCGGLQSDRLARLDGIPLDLHILPFRGEYYTLKHEKRHLVNHLIYPVPDPNLPFLGVHFTRMIDGCIHAGPNAVLSFKREGYQKTDFDWRDFREMLISGVLLRLGVRYGTVALGEWYRSIWKPAFVRSLQRLVPAIQSHDLLACPAGVRAQAVHSTGQLVDDFYFAHGPRSLHVCNAPSPAATASLEIGQKIVAEITK